MPRLTSSVFNDLAVWMAGFGLLIGVVFPAFALLLGVPASVALSPHYLGACVAAGLLVGGVNWALARLVVGRRLGVLADRMGTVAGNVRSAMFTGNWLECQAERCRVTVDSTDEIGRSARSFNELVDALSESRDVEAATARFVAMLSSELDVDRLSLEALRHLESLAGADAGAVVIACEGELSPRASEGIRNPAELAVSEHVRRAMRDGESLLIEMPGDVIVDSALTSFRPRDVLVVPLLCKSGSLGALVLASARELRFESRRLVELLCPSFGLALNNAIAHERLQRLAAFDPLTDCYNRRFGLSRLREEFSRTVRSGMPLGVIMLDIDHFKKVNDGFGHVVGDRVLRAVGQACRRALREGDLLVRYGGDEYIAVLPNATLAEASLLARRLRKAVADVVVTDGDHAVGVTVSVGVASHPEHEAENETALLESADSRMYDAKRNGRNQVVSGLLVAERAVAG